MRVQNLSFLFATGSIGIAAIGIFKGVDTALIAFAFLVAAIFARIFELMEEDIQ